MQSESVMTTDKRFPRKLRAAGGACKNQQVPAGSHQKWLGGKGKHRDHRKKHAWKCGFLLQSDGIKNSELRWVQFFNRNELGPIYRQILIQTTNRRKHTFDIAWKINVINWIALRTLSQIKYCNDSRNVATWDCCKLQLR